MPFALAAIACCIVLFLVGIGFGIRQNIPPLRPGNNSGPLIDKINVVAPKFGHAPVRAATVTTCKEVLRTLPPAIYNLLEKGGASVNLAPNIEDNWPGSGDGQRPGPLEMTMGEETGRCYDNAVWLYESKKVRGSQTLRPPRSQETMKSNLYQLLGHAVNYCMGGITNKEELKKAYDEDLDNLPLHARFDFLEESQRNDDSRALGCSEIIGVLIGGDEHHDLFPTLNYFPKTTAYLKKQLGAN